MSNWTTIDELRSIFINNYTDSKLDSELEKACSEEHELMRDYNGRQILELLQNVDDAYGEKKAKSTMSDEEVEVKITYKDNILEVGNTGTSFTHDTIERLCLGRASNKSSKNIGNKGTGFRSLLNDAEWIELYSGEFAIRFSINFTKQNFENYLNNDLIIKQKKSWQKDYELCFPIMNCPERIEMAETNFDTLIRVKLKEENQSKETGMVNQLNQPFYKSLLFLPNITKISIETNTEILIIKKLVDGINVLVERSSNRTDVSSEEYFVFSKEVGIHNKQASLLIAIPKDERYDFKKEKLYCYFPIRNFQTPINALLNAPFITNNSRDDIPNDNEGINKKLFCEILIFVREVAEKLAKPVYSDMAIKLVTPMAESKLWDPDGFNQHNKYFDLLSNANILPTVNNDYISMCDTPKIFEYEFPHEFIGESFSSLIQHLESKENIEFIKKLAGFIAYDELSFSPNDLADKINIIGGMLNISVQVKIFLWWSKYYKSSDIVPGLLMDSQNKWIKKSDKLFLPTDSGISILPDELSWVKLCILRQDYVDELIRQIKATHIDKWEVLDNDYKAENTGNKRLLAAFSKNELPIEFTEQSSSELVIRFINSQIDNQHKAITFINWFFENYKDKLIQGSELSKVPFNLPDENGNIKSATDLFLGKNYGNPLGEKLFPDGKYAALMEPRRLYNGNKLEEYIFFIEKCGIVRFPLIKSDVPLERDYEFKYFISKKYSKNINFNINYLKSKSIDNFKRLVSTLETSEIIEWINKDKKLQDLLCSNHAKSNATQNPNWCGFSFHSNEYVKYVLNTTPWIEFESNKYSPQQIVKYERLGSSIPNLYGISEQRLASLVGKDIMQFLDFKESLADFGDKEIEAILDSLPSFDKGEISRKLYMEIIKHKKDENPKFSCKNIKVLAKDGKFYISNEVKYADKKLPKSIESHWHFIAIPVKQNISTIENWLGVERYKSNLKIKYFKKLDYNIDGFKQEINDIKIAVLSTIEDYKTNVENIKKMQIIPCSEIIASDEEQNGLQASIDNFYFVDEGRKFYLKLPDSPRAIEELRSSDGFSNAIVDIFKQLLTLELDSNLIEILVSRDHDKKRKKISDEFGIDKWKASCELLFNENLLNQAVIGCFFEKGANDNIISQINEIDFSYSLKETDYEILINCLKQVKIDVSTINELSELINIDMRPYWQKKLRQHLDEKEQVFKGKLFNILIADGDVKKQNEFLSRLGAYKNYSVDIESITNSIEFDLEQEAYNAFPALNTNIDIADVDSIYRKNYGEINYKNLFGDEIANNQEVQIMIYFNRTDDFNAWIFSQQEKNSNEQLQNQEDPYKKFEDIIPEKKELEFHDPEEISSSNKNRRTGVYRKSIEDIKNKNKKIIGNKGELIVYNLLCKQYDKENVFPNSEAFVDLGILKPGQASSGEYDLSYKDKKGEKFFVEVKTGDGKSFIITPGELSFAKDHKDHFELYLISEIDSHPPKYQKISGPFWEPSSGFRLNEVIERIEVDF